MPRSKYGAVPTTVDNVRFASKKEAVRYGDLKILERAGKITGLELQRKFAIEHNGHKICTYICDFDYFDSDGKQIIEDVKGVKTAVYRIKKRLIKAFFDIDIQEI